MATARATKIHLVQEDLEAPVDSVEELTTRVIEWARVISIKIRGGWVTTAWGETRSMSATTT